MKIKHTVERITDFFFSIVTKKDRHYADILMLRQVFSCWTIRHREST